jgi:hypothetical protein
MSENIDINVALINEEITISAVNNLNEVVVNAVSNTEEINVTANTNFIQVNINTAPLSIINPQDYDLSQFTNTSPNPFVQQNTLSTYVPIFRTIKINGVLQDLSADRSWTISTNWGSIGGSLSSQGDLVAALATKQDTLTLTTTGSSGAATLVGATLNIPNYTISGLGGVPSSRTLTINGTTYDLSANRTWTIATGITIGSTPITAGTVGRVLFEGTGNVIQESGNLFWDQTNNRLGIGTSIPTSTLDVNGQIQSNLGLNLDKTSGQTQIYFRENGTLKTQLTSNYADGNFYLYHAMANRLVVSAAGNILVGTTTDAGYKLDVNGTFRVSGNSIFSSGSVGIGTATPSGKLHLSTSDATILAENPFGGKWAQLMGGSGISGIGFDNSGTFSIFSQPNAAKGTFASIAAILTINSNNIGIGTITPTSALDVVGIIASSRSVYGNPSSLDGYRIRLQDYGGIHNDAGIGIESDGGPMWFNNVAAGGGFYWSDGTNGEKMRLTSTGYLGVGATSPLVSLHVKGNDGFNSQFLLEDSLYPSSYFYQGYSGNTKIAKLGTTDNLGSIAFAPGNIESVRFLANGNVGIGTTNPTKKLHVIGDALFADQILVQDGNHTIYGDGSNLVIGSYAGRGIDFQTGGTSKVRLTSAGNLGIGTTSPSGKLDTYGDGYFGKQDYSYQAIQKVLTLRGDAISGLYAENSYRLYTTPGALSSAQKLSIRAEYNGSESSDLITIQGNGNVGIGTTNPSDKLTIESSGTGTGLKIIGYQPENFINLNNVLSTGNRTFRLIAGITSVGYEGFSIFDTVANDTRFVINNLGNIGIGTTIPGAKLEIASPSSGATILVGRANGNSSIKALPSESGYLALDSAGTATIINHYSSDNVWLVTGGGNVLINTTTDVGYKLDVVGSARITNTTRFESNLLITSGSAYFQAGSQGVYFAGNSYIIGNAGDITIGASGTNRNIYLNPSNTGTVSVNNATPSISALLDLASTTKGFLPPRMTTTQKNAIATPATGLVVYDTTLNALCTFDSTIWVTLGSGGGGGASIVKLTSQTLTAASWALVSGYYQYTFSNVNITTNTRVDFTTSNASYTEVTTCGMLPQVDVAAGSCTFYSLFPPQSNILGEITIFPTI